MPTATGKKYLEELDPVEFMAVLEEGGRKFVEECNRLGISRIVELDGQPVLAHPDGTHTPLPSNPTSEEIQAFLKNYKVSLRDVRYP